MKPRDRKAFSLIEVLCAIALFTTATLVIIRCFLEHATMPRVDQTAVALIADIDNCMTHREDLQSETKVCCLFDPNEHFKATCKEQPVDSKPHLKLWTLTIEKYPRVSREVVAYLYEYIP
ncbi:MAG: prepilin-type N-terminal cleavage/methylation domain-containing protein [Puniceicoccales bacterium]|jgi:prepilin-type N-terminal cleavage/methylation domain-containing protein|nr:prepilin-type N-terminal cleavage/methylation domain-containing protein [Puniceicoccales bacterium]